LHEENLTLKEQVKAGQEKLLKAKAVSLISFVNLPIICISGLSSSNRKTSCSKRNKRPSSLEQHPCVRIGCFAQGRYSHEFEQSNFEEAEASFRSQIKILEDENARQKVSELVLFF
jgi:rRNA pseudouridine-1189 N-methylase Emg1 (Nep1/Mra1 family)